MFFPTCFSIRLGFCLCNSPVRLSGVNNVVLAGVSRSLAISTITSIGMAIFIPVATKASIGMTIFVSVTFQKLYRLLTSSIEAEANLSYRSHGHRDPLRTVLHILLEEDNIILVTFSRRTLPYPRPRPPRPYPPYPASASADLTNR